MNNCKCDECKYCHNHASGNALGRFHCNHPNQKHILDYFQEHSIKKMSGFIGYGEGFGDVPKNKTTPKWCPLNQECD